MEFTNRLINETSPYLLQHAHNPVDWYPWGAEAFQKAEAEDLPIFLSIGYSTCHWCHVMERESFEDQEVAQFLNANFISIKVDKEERPDIDTVYMNVCQTMTGGGGWPMTILMTPQQKPFYAGTYLPKVGRYQVLGLMDLLSQGAQKWRTEKNKIEQFADGIIELLNKPQTADKSELFPQYCLNKAYETLSERFDSEFGGFGAAPKFPMAHGLSFLLAYHLQYGEAHALEMAEKTLIQMYKGGIFDHIGFGFSRYATDSKWLVPHFEKMLYDNALLIMAYTKAYEVTKNTLYQDIASKIITYIFETLLDEHGGFYCAQDADSDGVEGKYYIFRPDEIKNLLGDTAGDEFNQQFGITEKGNFEGASIPNLMISSPETTTISADIRQKIYDYRKTRHQLHLDDKILTAWNGLMIGALVTAYQQWKDKSVLENAKRAAAFIKAHLTEDDSIFTSYRNGKRTDTGFIDDYAYFIFGLLKLYQATYDPVYLEDAHRFTQKAIREFYDDCNGGFYLYGASGEKLFARPKEIYDGAIPSGNSLMAYNLFYLSKYFRTEENERRMKQQFNFMLKECFAYPSGNAFFLTVLLLYENPPQEIVCVLENAKSLDHCIEQLPQEAVVTILTEETQAYPLMNGKTTFYVCEKNHCLPPTNTLKIVSEGTRCE